MSRLAFRKAWTAATSTLLERVDNYTTTGRNVLPLNPHTMSYPNPRQDKATTERHAKTLRELVKRPDNKLCADCKRNGKLLFFTRQWPAFMMHTLVRPTMGFVEYVWTRLYTRPNLLISGSSSGVFLCIR